MDDRRRRTVPPALVIGSELVWRTAVAGSGAIAVVWVLIELRLVTVPALIALLAATVLHPPAAALLRRGWPPFLATWAVMLTALAAAAGGIALLVPAFLDQTDELGRQVDEGIAAIENWLKTGPLDVEDPNLRGLIDTAGDRVLDAAPGPLVDGVTLAAELVAGVLFAAVMAFFFVKDGERIVDWAVGHITESRRHQVREAGAAAWGALGAYVRGTAVVGVVNGTVIGIGLAVLGVPLALPLAVITALSAFFPFVGAVAAGALAALVALVSGGVVDAAIVVALSVAVQQVEGDVLSPLVMGRALALHPLVILVSLTVGAVTAGLVGAFLAVPFVGVAVAAAVAARQAPPEQAAASGEEGGTT